MTTRKKIAPRKLGLLALASELGNVSKACRLIGNFRQRFCGIRRNHQVHGAAGLVAADLDLGSAAGGRLVGMMEE